MTEIEAPAPLQGLIFDLDGTLADTLPLIFIAFRRALLPFRGREYTDAEIVALFGPSEEGSFQREVPDDWEACAQIFYAEYEKEHGLCDAPFNGIEEVLTFLQERGVRLAVVTGKGPRSTAITLERLALTPYFDLVEAGSPQGGIKPQAIRRVIAHWNLPSEQVAYIGDAPSDVESARTAGVLPLAAAWAATADYDRLARQSPQQTFATVQAFYDWLRGAIPQ